jgi:hypothetical protein
MVISPKKNMMLFGKYPRMPLEYWMDISDISISRKQRMGKREEER